MAKTTKTKIKKVAEDESLSEAEIFKLAEQYEKAAQKAAVADGEKKTIQRTLTTELLERRKTSAIESSAYGGFTRITAVQNETVVYNEDALWSEFSPKERRLAFDEFVNLNALPIAARKKVLEALSKEERKAVTSQKLNTEKLAAAVAEDEIDARIVARNAEIKRSQPFVRISHGSGS